MEASIDWNIALFHFFNASQSPTQPILGVVIFFAQYVPFLILGLLALAWVLGGPDGRRSIMLAGVSLILGLAVNFAFAAAIYVPRPFEAGLGQTYLAHAPETSFPSDHATFLWSLGFGLLIAPGLRWMGFIIVLAGAVTAWARVFLGVHFPLDMAGSLLISIVAAFLASTIAHHLDRRIFPTIEEIYVKIVNSILRRPVG